MRTLQIVPVALLALLCGCGVLASDDTETSGGAPPATSSETFGAPLGGDPATSPSRDELELHQETADLGGEGAMEPPAKPGDPPAKPGDPPAPPGTSPVTPPAPSDPGAPPPATCSVQKDSEGFFVRTSAKSEYVAYVPASYSSSAPMRVVVGLHGCGDTALNFAKWGVNPWAGRASQQHIGISVGGETGNNKCWNIGGDDDKVMAAVDDLAKCFWVNRSKVVVAGFSSGGQLAYRVGLMKSSSFAGILIESSGLYAAGSTPATLLSGAGWKLPIAHRAHSGDSVFPIAKVKADWATINGAGFPLTTSEVAGPHDGNSEDWANFLLPQSASWVRPAGATTL